MDVPAFCDTCAAVFRSGIDSEEASGDLLVGQSVGPCPVCAGMGHIADGVVEFLDRTIALLAAPERNRDELTRLASILTEACGGQWPRDEISARLQEAVPDLSAVIEFVPETSRGFYSCLTLIVAAISLLVRVNGKAADAAELTADKIIDHIIEKSAVVAAKQGLTPQSSVRRNAPCRCGSGKRFKQCCGRLA